MSTTYDLKSHTIPIPPDLLTAYHAECEEEKDGFIYIPNFITEDEEAYLIEKISSAPQPKWKTLQNRRLQYWGGQVSASNVLIPQPMPEFFDEYPDLISRLEDTRAFANSKHGQPNHCLVNEYLAGQGIMPHEDGAAYFPAVATINLGSHTLLDIYRYVDDDLQKKFDQKMQAFDKSSDQSLQDAIPKERIEGNVKIVRSARAREANPVFSILQEPRSLLITTGKMYNELLHGIAERTSDPASALANVVNGDLLGDPSMKKAVETAKQSNDSDVRLDRTLRLSLTFRDVERVSKSLQGLLGVVAGKR